MPEITSETPRSEITVAGQTFKVPQPYTAGHVLVAGEASALNQTYAENLRNNFAAKVKEAIEAGSFDADVFQGRFDDYAGEYEFGVRVGGGGRSSDPVQAEAMNIARDLVRKALAKQIGAGTLKAADGSAIKLSDIPAGKISELAKGVLAKADDKAERILATARQRVEAQKELDVDVETDSLGDEASEAEAPKGRKPKEA